MAVFKCKMCGGTIEFEQGATVGICDSCGTKQTLPNLNDDRRANLYDRANHFRRNNEFDKAAGIYEQILNETPNDAEAYWSLVLCRYGIEYVEDPLTHRRVPTVNRTQFTSVFDDDNYKSALKYADGNQRVIYEAEANVINEIQKGILAISQQEKPFDVFICYKETDESGRRTQDSVLANDLYHQLVQEGFKVFFSRITLEDKLGTAYEPYIFAALNSAKVMVVLGTKPENFNAVWVKNEWSRYLALVKESNGKKILIPAYRDMDPYDLPEEFSHLQAQDMSKLGFMQDLIRGIKKIIGADEPKTVVRETVVGTGNANITALLKRAFMFLEDGDWSGANEYAEKVLDLDPENAYAYLGKLMAELGVHRQDELANCVKPFDENSNYQKVMRFGDDKLKSQVFGYVNSINERNKNQWLTDGYNAAKKTMSLAGTEGAFISAAEGFEALGEFEDSSALAIECRRRAEDCRKEEVYAKACAMMSGKRAANYQSAIESFRLIPGWKDVSEKIAECETKIAEIKWEEGKKAEERRIANDKRKRGLKRIGLIVAICVVLAGILAAFILFINPLMKYNSAKKMIAKGKYEEAIVAFEKFGNYKNSKEYIDECNILLADRYFENENWADAVKYYEMCPNNSFADETMQKYVTAKYNYGTVMLGNSNYKDALLQFDAIKEYKDVTDVSNECMYQLALDKNTDYEQKYNYLKQLSDIGYKDSVAILKNTYVMSMELFVSNDRGTFSTVDPVANSVNIYCNFKIKGVVPGVKPKLKCIYSWTGYTSDYVEIDDMFTDRTGCVMIPSAKIYKDRRLIPSGKLTFSFYTEAGELINSISVDTSNKS